jgi:uncharacterized protein (TIGR02001 family)
MTKLRYACAASMLALLSTPSLAELTGNVGISNNYLWRGLTQSNNETAVSGGLDFDFGNGWYAGTWASNVEYASDDTYSYEHDVYFGYSGGEDVTYDIGWLYYNYDDINNVDFHEVYATVEYGGFSVTGYLLTGTEANEPTPLQDFGAGEAYYLSLDYGFETDSGLGVGFHAGRHDGDFNEFFNGVPASYSDYSVSFSKDNFSFTISDTDLPDAGADNLDNDEIKFVVSYGMEFDL